MEIFTDENNQVTNTYYTHGQGVDEHLAMERNNGISSSFYYFHADGLGSIAAITDSTHAMVQSYEYESFGMVKPSTNFRNSFTYIGKEYDWETGLSRMGVRYYDLMEGRFIGRDPIGPEGGINLYGYVESNPINSVDLDGLAGESALLRILGKLPRNWRLAGKTHSTGTPFKANGFPDFSKVAVKNVSVKQTGNRCADEAAANMAAGLAETPKGYTWHHVEDGSTMQLVDTVIHSKTGHTGGVALKKAGLIVLSGISLGLEFLKAIDPLTYITSGEMEPPPGFEPGPFGTWTKIDGR